MHYGATPQYRHWTMLLQVTVFNEPASVRNPHDLSLYDLDIVADVKRLKIMLVFSFLARVQVYLYH